MRRSHGQRLPCADSAAQAPSASQRPSILACTQIVLLLSSAAALLCRNESCTTPLVICQDPEVLQGCLDASQFVPSNTVQQLLLDGSHNELKVGILFHQLTLHL